MKFQFASSMSNRRQVPLIQLNFREHVIPDANDRHSGMVPGSPLARRPE
ncbi:hypothetical protein [Bradyrhizobium sp. UFLA05-112]